MFDSIARSYDLMNRVMTLGQDQRWRRFVRDRLGDPGRGWILDLATGTGDIAQLCADKFKHCRIVGADFSPQMLIQARRRFPSPRMNWQ
ncbi:unnamed protein product, partial [Cyprideis torosa]